MKGFHRACLLVFVALLSASGVGCAGAVGSTPPPKMPAAAPAAAAKLPGNLEIYATTTIGGGWRCEVGAKLAGDLLQEQPVVYLAKPVGKIAWHKSLGVPEHFYQGRATHCVASGDQVYVLVQLDTDSRQSLNQTVLRVVALDRKTGAWIAGRDVDVPGTASAYTSWVDEGSRHFRLEGNRLVIAGEYQSLADRDSGSGAAPKAFVVELSADPHR